MAVAEHFARAIMTRRAGDAAAGMGPRPAHIEAAHRPAIIAIAQHRPRCPELIERHMAVHDVSADQAELALQPKRGERAMAEHGLAKARREMLDRVEDR